MKRQSVIFILFFLALQDCVERRSMWIGVSDIIEEDRWEYSSTQEVVSISDWGPGEPNAHTAENCGLLWFPFHGQWGDYTCSEKINYICEEITPSNPENIIG